MPNHIMHTLKTLNLQVFTALDNYKMSTSTHFLTLKTCPFLEFIDKHLKHFSEKHVTETINIKHNLSY